MAFTIVNVCAIVIHAVNAWHLVESHASRGKFYTPFQEFHVPNCVLFSLPNNHPCTRPCHAPSSCSESEPCQSLVTLTCPCGRIKQSVTCGRTSSSGSVTRSSQPTLKCTNDCLVAKRNARLAEALGINTEVREKAHPNSVYGDELANFARANGRFLVVVEKAFAE